MKDLRERYPEATAKFDSESAPFNRWLEQTRDSIQAAYAQALKERKRAFQAKINRVELSSPEKEDQLKGLHREFDAQVEELRLENKRLLDEAYRRYVSDTEVYRQAYRKACSG